MGGMARVADDKRVYVSTRNESYARVSACCRSYTQLRIFFPFVEIAKVRHSGQRRANQPTAQRTAQRAVPVMRRH